MRHDSSAFPTKVAKPTSTWAGEHHPVPAKPCMARSIRGTQVPHECQSCFQPTAGAVHTLTPGDSHRSLQAPATPKAGSLHFPAQLCRLSQPQEMFCQAGEQSWAQQCPTLPAAPQPWLLGRGSRTAWARSLPRASCQPVEKLPKPLLTMSRIEAHAQLLDKKCCCVFLGMFTILKHRESSHLDHPWPVTEFRTAQGLCAGHTGSRKQPHWQVVLLGKTPGTLFQHWISCLSLPKLSPVFLTSPCPALDSVMLEESTCKGSVISAVTQITRS